MNNRKILLAVLIAIPVVLIGVAMYASFSLNQLARQGIEGVGSAATGTPVTLQEAAISILSGEGSLSVLQVGNPAGFSTRDLLRCDSIAIEIDTQSLVSDTLIIKNIDIRSPAILYEVSSSSSNLRRLLKNIDAAASAASPAGQAAHFKKLVIQRLSIRDGKISILAPAIKEPVNVALPTLSMTDIGREQRGVDIHAVLSLVVTELANATAAASNASLNDIRERYGVKLDGETKGIVNTIKDKASELGDKVRQLFQ